MTGLWVDAWVAFAAGLLAVAARAVCGWLAGQIAAEVSR